MVCSAPSGRRPARGPAPHVTRRRHTSTSHVTRHTSHRSASRASAAASAALTLVARNVRASAPDIPSNLLNKSDGTLYMINF